MLGIDGVAEGSWHVSAFGDDPFSPLATAAADAGAAGVVLRIGAWTGPRTVHVRIVDAEGRPVPDATARSGRVTGNSLVAASGESVTAEGFTLTVEPGEPESGPVFHFVEAWDARDGGGNRLPLGHVFAVLPADAPATFTVTMPPERAVRGRVVGTDGSGVEGASVAVEPLPPSALARAVPRDLGSVRALAGGAFEVRGLGAGSVRLRPSAPGRFGDVLTVEPGAEAVVLRLLPAAVGVLRVVDEDGRPVEGASVWISPARAGGAGDDAEDGESLDAGGVHARTDSAGRAAFDGLRPGVPHLVLVSPRSAREGLRQHRDEAWMPASGDVRLARALAVEGRVRARGADPSGNEGWSVVLVRGDEDVRSTRVEAGGAFAFRDVEPGTYEVRVVADGPPPRVLASATARAGDPPTDLPVDAD